MTCREFQSQWDALLDADARAAGIGAATTPDRSDRNATPAIDDGEEDLLAHAASCPECRELTTQWRTLRHAIRAWRQPPLPPAGLADRILAANSMPQSLQWHVVAAEEHKRSFPHILVLVCTLAAGIVLALILPRLEMMLGPSPNGRPAKPPMIADRNQDLHSISDSASGPVTRDAFNHALAEATSATWDLARSASEPAARISRDMLDATTQSEDDSPDRTSQRQPAVGGRSVGGAGSLTVRVLSLEQLAPDPSAASTVLQQVGDHFSAGVRPLSDTARHAFGFLIGPARDQPGPRTSSPSAKGA